MSVIYLPMPWHDWFRLNAETLAMADEAAARVWGRVDAERQQNAYSRAAFIWRNDTAGCVE